MLDIEQELLSNICLKNIDVLNSDIFEVKNIIDKYKLKTTNTLPVHTSEIDNEVLIEYIITLYINNEKIPSDIAYLIENNTSFRVFLLSYVKDSMRSIINDETTIVYKEIFIIINLLSMGKNYNIFTHYNFYSVSNIQKLFGCYERKLYDAYCQKNDDEFTLTFQSYLTLIEIFNELCVINSLDVQRRKSIIEITDCMVETISNTKSEIKLDENRIIMLNNILGKLLLYFSYVPYINVEKKNSNYIIQEYMFIVKKLIDGYKLLCFNKNSQDIDTRYNYTFLDKITTLILTLLLKLESKDDDKNSITANKDFIKIISLYNRYSFNKYQVENISYDSFKQHLLNNYLSIYNKSAKNEIKGEYKKILDDFIEHNIFCSSNMVILHNIILFDNDISNAKLESILNALLSIPQLNNDYHEFFKLKIIDRIIQLCIDSDVGILQNTNLENIVSYIETNKTASHLIGMYSKLYLSLSYYYSFLSDEESNELSTEYYSLFVNIDNYTLLNSEYKNIDNKILKNYGVYYLQNLKNKNALGIEDLILIGRRYITNYLNNRDAKIKLMTNSKITMLIKDILSNNIKEHEEINNVLDDIFSKSLFYGLVIVNIEKEDHISYGLDDIGYDHLFIKLNDEYQLSFYYSRAYSHIFNLLYESNVEYIQDNMTIIIDSYIKSIPTYIDEVTQLPNLKKLQYDLLNFTDELIFIEIYLNSLVTISKNHTYQKSNEYFLALAKEINRNSNVYRLTGPRIGITVKKDGEYKDIIKNIKEIEITFEEERYTPSFTIAVSFGLAHMILDKSHYALSAAKLKNNNYYEFK